MMSGQRTVKTVDGMCQTFVNGDSYDSGKTDEIIELKWFYRDILFAEISGSTLTVYDPFGHDALERRFYQLRKLLSLRKGVLDLDVGKFIMTFEI